MRGRIAGSVLVVATIAVAPGPAFASVWTANLAAASHGESRSGTVSETVNGSCTSTSPGTSCGTGNVLPSAGSSSTLTVANSGTLPVSYGLTATGCGAATVADTGATLTVAHGGFIASSYQASGPLAGMALTFDGSTTWLGTGGNAISGLQTFTELAWFKTSSATGGAIMSFQDRNAPADSVSYDRALWVDNTGHLVAGVAPGSMYEAVSPATVNNGTWHLAAVTLASGGAQPGLRLYIDGLLVTTNLSATSAKTYSGWWNLGAAKLSGWADAPTLDGSGVARFTGSLAGPAIISSALSAATISSLYSSASFSGYATAVAGNTPAHYWGLQDAAPTSATAWTAALPGQTTGYPDVSGYADDATVVGGVSLATSGPLGALSSTTFNGATGWLTTASNITAPQVYTQLAWFKTTSGGVIMSVTNSTTPNSGTKEDRHVWVDNSGKVVTGVWTNSANEAVGTTTVNDGAWHLAAVTLSGAGLKLYVDGTLQATNPVTAADTYHGGAWWSIGYGYISPGGWPNSPAVDYFNGSLGGVAVVPSALSAAQIASLYASADLNAYGSSVLASSPSSYWPLTGQASACTAALITVAVTVSGVTTCILPTASPGVACPAAGASSVMLANLTAATIATAVTAPPGSSATITISVADNGTLASALADADVVTDTTVGAGNGPWQAGAVYPNSITRL